MIPKSHQSFRTRTNRTYTNILLPNWLFQKFFLFPSVLSDWFQLDVNIRNSESIAIFISRLLSFIRPMQSNVYNIFDPIGLKFLTRLRLDFNHLNEHRFRHNFQDCLNPLCSCSLETEDTKHYLLHCNQFSQHRIDLINSMIYIFAGFDSSFDNAKKRFTFTWRLTFWCKQKQIYTRGNIIL